MPERITVEVVYALPAQQTCRKLEVESGTTAEHAVLRSGLFEAHPELSGKALKLGLHGRLCTPSAVLRDGDRVEIYRPLTLDPKDGRRKRVGEARKRSKA